jgi:hypothetical protein
MKIARYICFSIFAPMAMASAFSLSAQSPRSTPKPLATPPRVLTAAEIISRADELFESPIIREGEDPKDSSESPELRDLKERLKRLEAGRTTETPITTRKVDQDEVQKRMLMNLDILTRAEQRTDALRKQLFEMIEKENTVRARIEQIDFDSRPEIIERQLQLAGSMKPEEVRESRRKSLAAERANLDALLSQIQATRQNVNSSLQRSETLVDKIRAKLEKDIDDALIEPEPDNGP